LGQNKGPEDNGFKHLQTITGDTVDILIKFKKEKKKSLKPLFLFDLFKVALYKTFQFE